MAAAAGAGDAEAVSRALDWWWNDRAAHAGRVGLGVEGWGRGGGRVAAHVLVVNVHEAALDGGQCLDFMLEQDPAIVTLAQRRVLVHHQFKLHKEARPKVVGSHGVEAD